MQTVATPKVKRPDHSGSLHQVKRTVRGKTYLYWRATGYIFPADEKPVLVKAEGKTPPEASAALERKKTEKQVELGILGPSLLRLSKQSRKRTVEVLLMDFLAYKKPSMRLNSWKDYESKIRNYLVPEFGDKPLAMLDREDLNDYFLNRLPALGTLGVTAQKAVFFIFSSALNYAVQLDYLDKNPLATAYRASRNRRSKAEVELIKQASNWVPKNILKAVQGEDDELRWHLGLFGLRQSEVLGITLDCIKPNLKKPERILIRQQLDRITAEHGCGEYSPKTRLWSCGRQADNCPNRIGETKLFIREEVKTESGDRELPIHASLKPVLKRMLERREALMKEEKWEPLEGDKMDQLLFHKESGRPIRPQDDRARFEKVLVKAKVRHEKVGFKIRVHDLRHFAATTALKAGVAPDKMAMIFGWSSRQLHEMIKLYAHGGAKEVKSEIDAMAALLQERVS